MARGAPFRKEKINVLKCAGARWGLPGGAARGDGPPYGGRTRLQSPLCARGIPLHDFGAMRLRVRPGGAPAHSGDCNPPYPSSTSAKDGQKNQGNHQGAKKIFHNATKNSKINAVAQLRPSNGKEVKTMLEEIANLLLGVIASVIGTYICKWLDDQKKGN